MALEKRLLKRRRNYGKFMLVSLIIIVAVIMSVITPLRFDFAGGSHRIVPTAMDTDIWGNYKVYYKTSDFTHNRNEDFYYIDKGDKDLADLTSQNIVNSREMVVYYDRYIGWKGFTAPKTSPIIRIETVKAIIVPNPGNSKSLNLNQIKQKRMNLI